MARPIKPRMASKPDEFSKSPLSLFLDIKREDIKASPKRPRMKIISEEE
jgi:hypothetical protein